jgi:hypothetical protein
MTGDNTGFSVSAQTAANDRARTMKVRTGA